MAGVTLVDLHLADADDPSDQLVLLTSAPTWSPAADVEIRRLASGRRRIVRRPGNDEALDLELEVTDDQLVQLDQWKGRRLVLRDISGRVLWGMYEDFQARPFGGVLVDRYDVSLTFRSVTGTVEV